MATKPADPARSATQDKELEEVILRYLDRHPRACDTLEGIHTWWLRQQRFDDTLADVALALRSLVKRQAVEERRGGDGRVLFRLPEKRGKT